MESGDKSGASILVAVDMPLDTADLDPALDLARATGWTVHLLHVAAPEPDFVGYAETGGLAERQFRDQQLADYRSQLDALTRLVDQEGFKAESSVVEGPTVQVILRTAEEHDAQMIVIVGHKHTIAHRLLLGSVASALLKVATRPVLVLPDVVTEGSEIQEFDAAVDRLIDVIDRTEQGEQVQPEEQVVELRGAAQDRLERSDSDSEEEKQRLNERLRDALHHFETDHVSLTKAVNDVAYYLSGMGL